MEYAVHITLTFTKVLTRDAEGKPLKVKNVNRKIAIDEFRGETENGVDVQYQFAGNMRYIGTNFSQEDADKIIQSFSKLPYFVRAEKVKREIGCSSFSGF